MEETGRKGSRESDRTGEKHTHTQMARHEIQTLCSITGQGEDDVVAMLKKYGGDMDAATNALIDSESTARNPPDCSFAGALCTTAGKPNGGEQTSRVPRRRALAIPRPHPR